MKEFISGTWADDIVPALRRYIEIPNQSPAFDPDWRRAGHMDRAVDLVAEWIRRRDVPGLQLEVVRLDGRTPLLLVEVPGEIDATVLLYGHLDKQPPMDGWSEGLDPWTPVLRDGRLYGRGAADDGYAAFASVTAIEALRRQGLPHARCVILIEACEESGSGDLPAYIEALADRIGSPDLVVCLDSGCGDYERLWVTTSLRGLVNADLRVATLTEGVHSGGGGRDRALELSRPAPVARAGSRTSARARFCRRRCTSRFPRSADARRARQPRSSGRACTRPTRSRRACGRRAAT